VVHAWAEIVVLRQARRYGARWNSCVQAATSGECELIIRLPAAYVLRMPQNGLKLSIEAGANLSTPTDERVSWPE